jgi:hypothetical protein
MATPPVFTSGQILTAAQMNAAGLWLVKSQTIGSGVTSQAVTDAFTTDFEAYKIVVTGGVASAAALLSIQLGSTTSGYYYAHRALTYLGVSADFSGANVANFQRIGVATTNTLFGNVDLINPFLAQNTLINYFFLDSRSTGEAGAGGGVLANATSYTGFTLAISSGTMTGGTIRVYGYNK